MLPYLSDIGILLLGILLDVIGFDPDLPVQPAVTALSLKGWCWRWGGISLAAAIIQPLQPG